jgi:ATP-dependent Lhr-like helicase
LLYVYRMLEARGEIRGGRFVQGFSGEQFALPDAFTALRKIRKQTLDTNYSISAVDPLNLTGIITPGQRVPAVSGNRILYRNGVPVAHSASGTVHFLREHDSIDKWETRNALLLAKKPEPTEPVILSRPH